MHEDLMARILPRLVSNTQGCLLWPGAMDGGGYGLLNVRGKQMRVHRIVWEHRHNRPVPDGLMVRHDCGTRLCANGSHLLVGTAFDNAQDTIRHGRRPSGDTHSASKITEAEAIRAFELRRSGRTIEQVAQEIGLSYTATNYLLNGRNWKHLQRGDLPSRVIIQTIPKEAVEDALLMREDGKTWREIERATGYSRAHLSERLPSRSGFNPNPVILTPTEAIEAVRLRREGMSWSALSRHFDSRISRMGLYYAWRNQMQWWREAEASLDA